MTGGGSTVISVEPLDYSPASKHASSNSSSPPAGKQSMHNAVGKTMSTHSAVQAGSYAARWADVTKQQSLRGRGTGGRSNRDSHCSMGTVDLIDGAPSVTVVLGADDDGFDNDPEGVPFDDVMDYIHREIRLKASCAALPYSFLFYFVFIWSAWLKCDTYNYGVGSSVVDLFSNLEVEGLGRGGTYLRSTDIKSHDALWGFVKEGVVPLFWEEGDGRVRRFHKIVGGLRILQRRSMEEECHSIELREWFSPPTKCQSWTEMSSEPFGINTTDPAFTPSPRDPEVFEVMLPIQSPMEDIQARLDYLLEHGWLNGGTKNIRVQVGLYNGEVDAWALAQDEYKFLSDASVHHILHVATANNLFSMWYYFVADAMAWLLIGGLLFQEIRDACRELYAGRFLAVYYYGHDAVWHGLDWVSMGSAVLSFAGYIFLHNKREVMADSLVKSDLTDWTKQFVTLNDLETLIEWKKAHEVLLFLFALTLMIRFFKTFRGQPRLAVLSETFALCCSEVMYFFVIFCVIFSNFSLTGFLLFNSQIEQWSTVGRTLNECFKILMQQFDFKAMYKIHPFAASLWFWCYMVLVLLITLSMLIAVILETYSIAKMGLWDVTANSHGMISQLYYLWLQSSVYRYIQKARGQKSWMQLERISEAFTTLVEDKRCSAVSVGMMQGKNVRFVINKSTLENIGVPDGQIAFFYKCFDKLGLLKEKDDEESDDKTSTKEEETDLDAVNEDRDYRGEFDKLDGSMTSQESLLRIALRELLGRLAEMDPNAPSIPGQPIEAEASGALRTQPATPNGGHPASPPFLNQPSAG